MYNEWLDEEFARPGARRTRENFEICATAQVVITDRAATFEMIKPFLALYIGRDGLGGHQFPRRGLPADGLRRGRRGRHRVVPVGRKDEAAKVIPDELVDDAAIVGDVDYVRKQIAVWRSSTGVTL